MTLNEMGREASETAKAKGFDPVSVENVGNKLLLVVTEIAEAYEVMRDGIDPQKVWLDETRGNKPEGFGMELADAHIRIGQIAYDLGIDMDAMVSEKQAFNRTRPLKHGRKF